MDRRELEQAFPGIDAGQVIRHGQLVELWHGCTVEELASDLHILTQILAFKAHQAQVLAAAQLAHTRGATHDCGEWYKDNRCQLCGAFYNPFRPDETP
jgi:hypothetical protein